jgi:hypothetical protein
VVCPSVDVVISSCRDDVVCPAIEVVAVDAPATEEEEDTEVTELVVDSSTDDIISTVTELVEMLVLTTFPVVVA